MPIVEIARFSASSSLKADHSLINPALDHVRNAEGCMNIYYGFAEEDKEMIYLVIVWETYEHHQALMDPPNYPSLFKPDVGTIGMNHVELKGDASAAFTSPTTEFVTAKVKEGKSPEEFMAAMKSLGDLLTCAGRPVAVGETLEEPGKFFIIIGWESVKAHSDLVLSEKFMQPGQNVREVGDIQVLHVNLTKYA